nr:hypothetical protein Iba_scaffold450271CG0010 [Ipomoea batatas]
MHISLSLAVNDIPSPLIGDLRIQGCALAFIIDDYRIVVFIY